MATSSLTMASQITIGEIQMAERTTITIDRDLLIEAQRTAARKGVPMGVAGSTSKFIRFLLQDYCARNPAQKNG